MEKRFLNAPGLSEKKLEEYKSVVLALACCIRRAHNLPPGPSRLILGKEDSRNEHYWHTREACHQIARGLGVFFPDVIGHYEHVTNNMNPSTVQELSKEYWIDVMYPGLLVQEVMES